MRIIIFAVISFLFLISNFAAGQGPGSNIKKYGPKFLSRSRYYAGYNSFNEVYAGYQFPKDSIFKFVFELGYQFALTQDVHYGQGTLFGISNPGLTNNAKGFRTRVGYKIPLVPSRDFVMIYIEYQNLNSNDFLYYPSSSGSGFATYSSKFQESYQKYGVRLLRLIPILGSEFIFFTYSVALFYMDIQREYSEETLGLQIMPSNRKEYFHTLTPQLNIGVRFYLR